VSSSCTHFFLQLLKAIGQLHDYGIVHGDISLENVLLSRDSKNRASAPLAVNVIDFGMATTHRYLKAPRGKLFYRAPEGYISSSFDGFLSDTFAVGVCLYCLLATGYPWLSTSSGQCQCFDYVKEAGFRAYIAKRKIRSTQARGRTMTLKDSLSEGAIELLEGLLEFDPAKRLTLGENVYGDRKSAWACAWVRDGPRA